jgi:nitrogen fixation/metabolism regulation signal transduction histidine kinase
LTVAHSIVRPLQRVVGGADFLAQGDLSVHVDVVRHDEVGVLAESVIRAISQLAGDRVAHGRCEDPSVIRGRAMSGLEVWQEARSRQPT